MILKNMTKRVKFRDLDNLINNEHLKKVKLNIENHIKAGNQKRPKKALNAKDFILNK